MFCCEHLESVHGGAEEGALDRNKHVLRYLRGTMEYGLRYLGGDGVELQGYTDSDWEGSAVDRKSTSGVASTWDQQ
jgi:hypothetical protein